MPKHGADDTQVIPVTVNGKTYDSMLYGGVQRFVPDSDVEKLVNLAVQNFRGPAVGGGSQNFYDSIPDSLKGLSHPNAVVNFMVEANRTGFCSLNEIAIGLHSEKFSLEDWIEFQTLHGYSVAGFCDAVESQIWNLGLGEPYIDEEDGEEYEDYSAYFTIENPLWEE